MIILLDKPKGITSSQYIRKYAKENLITKIGHTGTLDPLATGLLLVATDQDTKLIEYIDTGFKEYVATAKFGFISTTYDIEGQIEQISDRKLTQLEISEKLLNFVGEQQQVPPNFSAKKVNGKRAYELARNNQEFNLQPVKVMIKEIGIIEYLNNILVFKISVSRGTYIRSIIHDLGQVLKTGAIMTDLRRTKIGVLGEKMINQQIDPEAILVLPIYIINSKQLKKLYNGIAITKNTTITGKVALSVENTIIGIGIASQKEIKSQKLFGNVINKILSKKEE